MFDTLMTMAQDVQQNTSVSYTADIMGIAAIVGMWKMFEKAGEPGWPALIPFYNMYKFCGLVMGNPWYWLRYFVFIIPIIGWIAGIYFVWQMCKATALAYGKPDSWAWGYLFLSGVFYCITGFDNSEYYGPMGIGDRRTSQARESKTVNFDVMKDQPEAQARPDVTEDAAQGYQDFSQQTKVDETVRMPEEETVDFIFDQPEE